MPQSKVNELLPRARAGESSAEEEIFKLLFERFTLFVKRRIGETSEAEDLAQEACMTVLQKYKTEQFTISFEAWAYGVLKMKIGNYLQSARIKRPHSELDKQPPGHPQTTVQAGDPTLRRQLLDCLKKLTRKNLLYARVVNLIQQGYQTSEITCRLSIQPNYMYTILNRGRSLLRNCLETGEL